MTYSTGFCSHLKGFFIIYKNAISSSLLPTKVLLFYHSHIKLAPNSNRVKSWPRNFFKGLIYLVHSNMYNFSNMSKLSNVSDMFNMSRNLWFKAKILFTLQYVPYSSIHQWCMNFERKIKLDPYFWKH